MNGQQPAFPHPLLADIEANLNPDKWGGMTLKAYAAIKLQVPDSGEKWLDDMIRKANRRELAAKAMQGIISHYGCFPFTQSEEAFAIADQMIAHEEQEATQGKEEEGV